MNKPRSRFLLKENRFRIGKSSQKQKKVQKQQLTVILQNALVSAGRSQTHDQHLTKETLISFNYYYLIIWYNSLLLHVKAISKIN